MAQEIDKYFAELAGAFAGDGWISKGNKGLTLFISGNPKDEKPYYKRIRFLFKKIFQITVNPRPFPYWGTFGVMVCKKEIINSFFSIGFNCGKKALTVKVPNKIQKNKKLFSYFIRGLFDTDGCIYFQKSYNKNASIWQKSVRHIPTVFFTSMSKELIDSTYKMNKALGLEFRYDKPTVPRYSKSFCYRIRLQGKKKVKRFFRIVKPKSKKHLDKFNFWITQGFY
jgi:hypothetical protein